MKSALSYVEVKMQSGTYDSGLFTVAFATAIYAWVKSSTLPVYQAEMRTHLEMPNKWKEDNVPNQNEEEQKNIKAQDKIPVFCCCRLPEIEGTCLHAQMIECMFQTVAPCRSFKVKPKHSAIVINVSSSFCILIRLLSLAAVCVLIIWYS